ncbi:unnamed protein product [marine sediment metagenome]|uniref:Uncharacterized protein n=1 Tax=marine sediment metagenome TaxID=412755 RepID=X1MTP8_9ZZZZ
MEQTIKRGSPEWWLYLAIMNAKPCKKGETAHISLSEANEYLDRLNRNPFKKLWLLLTNGDLHILDGNGRVFNATQGKGKIRYD